MKTKAVLMALAMMTTALAGCTSGTDGVPEVDEDALNELIDANLQDFINNTTIVVNNHYHNNTTVNNNHYDTTNEYNNTTNVDGGEVVNNNQYNGSGSGTGPVVQVFRTVWSPEGQYERPNHAERYFVLDGVVQAPVPEHLESFNKTMTYNHNGNTFSMSFTCEEFVNAVFEMDQGDWYEWVYQTYGDQNHASYTSQMIRDDLQSIDTLADDGYCWNGYYASWTEGYNIEVFDIPLDEGEAIAFRSLPPLEEVVLECDDGYSESSGNGSMYSYLIGGWTDCVVSGHTEVRLAYVYNSTHISNGTGPSIETPDWFAGNSYWRVYAQMPQSYYYGIGTPLDFIVNFEMHHVDVHDPDAE